MFNQLSIFPDISTDSKAGYITIENHGNGKDYLKKTNPQSRESDYVDTE